MIKLVLLSLISIVILISTSEGAISNGELTTVINGRSFINTKCSENVQVFTQGGYDPSQNQPQSNCPHKRTDLTSFLTQYGRLTNGVDISINSGSNILLKKDALPVDSNAVVNRITVKNGGTLIFDETDMTLKVKEIFVENGGNLWIGSETCRLESNIEIIFYGTKAESSLGGFSGTGATSKGLISLGNLDIHGKKYHPTWTRLSLTARPNDTIIFLGDQVNWEIGQQVLLVTSAYYDCPPEFQSAHCDNTPHQNEVKTITDISMDCAKGIFAIKLDSPIKYQHYAGVEYQAEVAVLSRKIKLSGSDLNDNFGAHTAIVGTGAVGRFSGVHAHQMGQMNILGRYPFHIHLVEGKGDLSYFQECLTTDSVFRSFVIHGTNGTRISRSVSYNTKGFSFYIEDGVEESNLIEYNLAAYVSPISKAADGDWGQGGETIYSDPNTLILPADASASGFYISNAYNSLIGNAASGGWSGFAFPNIPLPLGVYKDINYGYNNPENRPTLSFVGNTAHSTGFYWKAHGSAVYVGAWLGYENGVMKYISGRNDRSTYKTNTNQQGFMFFNHTKVWATNKAIAHWGNTVDITNYECHDSINGAMLFGQGFLSNAIINGRSGNTIAWETPLKSKTKNYTNSKFGFQYYDTWSQAILTRVTFRNFNATTDAVIRSLDHSDEFLPQGINSIRAIKYENVPKSNYYKITNCGPLCGGQEIDSSMASRIYNIWDFDGTFSGSGKPSIVGTMRNWWDAGTGCEYVTEYKAWRCDWTTNRQIGFIQLYIAGLTDGCDSTVAKCSGQKAYYTVGRVSHWGPDDKGVQLSPWSGVAGIANTGWYWRTAVSQLSIDGAPSQFSIGKTIQLPRSNFIVLAIKYPSTATFEVNLITFWETTTFNLPMSTKEKVLTKTETLLDHSAFTGCNITGTPPNGKVTYTKLCSQTGGVGPAWHFDGTYLYIRVVNPYCYTNNGKSNCQNNAAYTRDGASTWNIFNHGNYNIKVTSCPGCVTQSTYKGIDFYQVDNTAPPAFSPTIGSLRTYPAINFADSQVCPSGVAFQGCGTTGPTSAPTNSPTSSPSSGPTSGPTGSSNNSNSGSTLIVGFISLLLLIVSLCI